MGNHDGYLLPSTVDAERICFQIPVPNEQKHIAAFLGQLSSLGFWYTWERDETHMAKDVAAVWLDIYRSVSARYDAGDFTAGDCTVSICDEVALCQPNIRLGSNGGLEWFNPATGLWEPLPGSGADPRVDGHVDAPWPTPPTGQTGNCLGAANIVAMLKASNDTVIAEMALTGAALGIVGGLVPFVELSFPVIGIIATVVLELAGAYADYSASVLTTNFTDAVYHALQCEFQCFIASDGTITPTALSNMRASLGTFSSTVQNIVNAYFDVYGPNGLMKQERQGGIIAADCSDCDTCPWESVFDFRTSDYAGLWTVAFVNGFYTAGQGFETTNLNITGHNKQQAQPYIPLPGATGILSVSFDYTAQAAGNTDDTGVYSYAYGFYGTPEVLSANGDGTYSHIEAVTLSSMIQLSLLLDHETDGGPAFIRSCRITGSGTKPAGWP